MKKESEEANPHYPYEIVPSHPDPFRAKEYRARITEKLAPVIEIMNEAKVNGLEINFNIGSDAIGRVCVQRLLITKEL